MTRVESAALIIPVEGEPHLIVTYTPTDSLVWATGLLLEHGGGPGEITIPLINVETRKEVGTALMTVLPEGSENPRARKAVAHLTGGIHYVFRGPVLLAGLTRDSADEIEQLIGTK